MPSDGKQLENLVAFVEQANLPEGFTVQTNSRVQNDDGIQIAEFDVEVRGRVGTTDFAWLIECRDRPGSGAAPGAWIEQLVGRRTRFGFDKVTAVSTTGFAAGAEEFARVQGIELREVASLEPAAFADWFQVPFMVKDEMRHELRHAGLDLMDDESAEVVSSVKELMSAIDARDIRLRAIKSGRTLSLPEAFVEAMLQAKCVTEALVPNGPEKGVRLVANYRNDEDHLVIDTGAGPVRVKAIRYEGTVRLVQEKVPLAATSEYRRADSGKAISQVVAFAPLLDRGVQVTLEMHRMAESGETYVVVRHSPPPQ
jgi:hypothetical protein